MAVTDYLPQALERVAKINESKEAKATKKHTLIEAKIASYTAEEQVERASFAQKVLTDAFSDAHSTEWHAARAIAKQGNIDMSIDNKYRRPVKSLIDFFGACADELVSRSQAITKEDVEQNAAFQDYCKTLESYGCNVDKIDVTTSCPLVSADDTFVTIVINHDKNKQASFIPS